MNDLDRSAAFSGVLQGGRRTPRTMGIALTQLRGEESEQMKAAVAAELAEQKKHSTTHSSWTPAEVGKKDTWSTRRTEEMERLRVETEATLVEQGVNARSAMQNYNTLVKCVAYVAYFYFSLIYFLYFYSFFPLIDTLLARLEPRKRWNSSNVFVQLNSARISSLTPFSCNRLLVSA